MITIGLDLGTSALKAVLFDEQLICATASTPLGVSTPQAGFSEQDPEQWWRALEQTFASLRAQDAQRFSAVGAIGLAGQMHGATLIDKHGQVLRPCILWNDGRSVAQCETLLTRCPDIVTVTGNAVMAGFTAPKLLWVQEHEPELFAKIDKVLLPKAYLNYRLSGEYFEDFSDASGTLWFEPARQRWHSAALAACGLGEQHMPKVIAGDAAASELSPALQQYWGFTRRPLVAAGAGDNAATAVALGAIRHGDAFISLGTSGVVWVTTERFAPNPSEGVHAFCHTFNDTWHQMGVLLSAAACLNWWAGICGSSEAALLDEAASAKSHDTLWFVPYLNGDRTPHNNPQVRGGFLGLAAEHTRGELTRAVLEGVAYALADSLLALRHAGTDIKTADVVGGGAHSALWCQIIADVLNIPLRQVTDQQWGCATGAARLAQLTQGAARSLLTKAVGVQLFEPCQAQSARHQHRLAQWQKIYPLIHSISSTRNFHVKN
jgi:xylulokinase